MHIAIVTTDLLHASRGNQVTAFRWQRLLEGMGHQVSVINEWKHSCELESVQLLVAIHARKSNESVVQYRRRFPDRPIVVCLSGTDLQVDMLPKNEDASGEAKMRFDKAMQSCQIADRLILLEPFSQHRLPKKWREKVVVIRQSAEPVPAEPKPSNVLLVCQLAHLREIKDPFRVVEAVMKMPQSTNIEVVHAGQALSPEQQTAAREYEKRCARFKWVGGLPHDDAMRLLASSHCTVLSSKAEGAPSLISEAVVNGVPIIATRIDATIGLLGDDYPALFEFGDTEQLSRLLHRFETDVDYRQTLKDRLTILAEQFSPERERDAWAGLLAELDATNE